jgi:hypothetical protein
MGALQGDAVKRTEVAFLLGTANGVFLLALAGLLVSRCA